MTVSNSVFISYRRKAASELAVAVYQYLKNKQIDAFLDIDSIGVAQFDTVILNQIASRPYFFSILTPETLPRCVDEKDWIRRELEYAIKRKRRIVPIFTSDFDLTDISRFLPKNISDNLKSWNMTKIDPPSKDAQRFFNDMLGLCDQKLLPLEDIKLDPIPSTDLTFVEKALRRTDRIVQTTNSQISVTKAVIRGDEKIGIVSDSQLKLMNIFNFTINELKANKRGVIEHSQVQAHIEAFFSHSAFELVLMTLFLLLTTAAYLLFSTLNSRRPQLPVELISLSAILMLVFMLPVLVLYVVYHKKNAIEGLMRTGEIGSHIKSKKGKLTILLDGTARFTTPNPHPIKRFGRIFLSKSETIQYAGKLTTGEMITFQVTLFYYVKNGMKYFLSAEASDELPI